MKHVAITQYLYLLDEAFDGPEWHSLLGNLKALTPEDWTAVPAGGHRTIQDIIRHVGGSKLMYENHAFGDRLLAWDTPVVDGVGMLNDRESAIAWLREAHTLLRRSVAALDDDQLFVPRMTNWGEWKETRWIIAVMIQHDFYHAGEINHIRSLLQEHDRWAYES